MTHDPWCILAQVKRDGRVLASKDFPKDVVDYHDFETFVQVLLLLLLLLSHVVNSTNLSALCRSSTLDMNNFLHLSCPNCVVSSMFAYQQKDWFVSKFSLRGFSFMQQS